MKAIDQRAVNLYSFLCTIRHNKEMSKERCDQLEELLDNMLIEINKQEEPESSYRKAFSTAFKPTDELIKTGEEIHAGLNNAHIKFDHPDQYKKLQEIRYAVIDGKYGLIDAIKEQHVFNPDEKWAKYNEALDDMLTLLRLRGK